MSVISIRLKNRDVKRLNELSKVEKKDKSAVMRELVEYGWNYLMLKHYKEGKLSLGGLAKKLDVSISEAIDMLAEMGIDSPVRYDDYLKGFEVFNKQ